MESEKTQKWKSKYNEYDFIIINSLIIFSSSFIIFDPLKLAMHKNGAQLWQAYSRFPS